MGDKTQARGRNGANAALMGSPYAATAAVETTATLGPGAALGGGLAAGAVAARTAARRRDTPARRARRDLRRAAHSASNRSSGASKRSKTSKASKASSSRSAGSSSGSGRSLLGNRSRKGQGATGQGNAARTGRKSPAVAGHGNGRKGGSGSRAGSTTGVLDRKRHTSNGGRKSAARSGSPSSTSPSRKRGSHSGSGSRGAFGMGPRASAARSSTSRHGTHRGRTRGKGSQTGSRGFRGLFSGGAAPNRKRQGNKGRGKTYPTRGDQGRNARKETRSRTGKRLLGMFGSTRGGRLARRSWRPLRRALDGNKHPVKKLFGGVGGVMVAVFGTVTGAVMALPRGMSRLRAAGVVLHRETVAARAGLIAMFNPYDEELGREQVRPVHTIPTSGGITVSQQGSAEHLEALIEQVQSAAPIEKCSGVNVEAHAHAVAKLVSAVGEYLEGNVDKIKEELPQLDGGESLVQQVDLISAAANGAQQYADSFSATHEDRLRRQREPEPGEENWDTSAAQS